MGRRLLCNILLHGAGAVLRVSNDGTFYDHVEDAWATACHVIVDEPSERLRVVDECLDRNATAMKDSRRAAFKRS